MLLSNIPLRIGINALYLIPGAVGGTEIYLRSLLLGLAEIDSVNEYLIFVNAETAGAPLIDSPQFHTVHCRVNASFRPGRIAWEQFAFPLLLKKHRVVVLLNAGFTSPVFFSGLSVTVFHDLQHKRHPEFFRLIDLPFWNLMLWLSTLRSQRLIAVSEATAADLVLFYPRAKDKIRVVPHGVDAEFFRVGERRRTCSSVDNFILTVSTLHPHKNIRRLLEAFRIFHSSHPEYQLVVAGLKGFAADRLEAARRDLGLESSVRFTGWIPREDLYRLFERASGYIAPSEFEGFGMPVLEALAAGIPTACSSIAPFRASAGEAAAYFDPLSVSQIAEALKTVTVDAQYRLRAAINGPERALLFDWRHTAARTLDVLQKAAAEH